MKGGRIQWKVKVEVSLVEHPFIVLPPNVSRVPWHFTEAAVLTMDIESEKKYHKKIRTELMSSFLITSRSANLASYFETEICSPI
jgi:hypothetical protein